MIGFIAYVTILDDRVYPSQSLQGWFEEEALERFTA